MRNAPLPQAGSKSRIVANSSCHASQNRTKAARWGAFNVVQVIDVGIGQHRACRALGCFRVPLAKLLKAIFENAAKGLLHVVPRDEGRRVERPLLLPPRLVFLARLDAARQGRPIRCGSFPGR